ncbi:atypical/TAF1 protein kinase [Ephemerocybe angulata]|uniref:Atypical/TAF1 protein kinase n=1 Tax=Ephemerocybe angulata TaxID=980116 RepID=A0A8H6MH17_9AGAR|nr:atypical/TAF1 protein kinase [Tulosesus angulatus]
MSQEDDAISALTGFSLDHVLDGLSLPHSAGLTNQLGISGIPSLSSRQIYNEKWDDDEEAVGLDQGEDWEAEIDKEMQEEEESDDGLVKREAHSPGLGKKERRVRVVKRLVERPPTVQERFPTFAKDKVLDFSELFKGYTVRKSRLSKRPYQIEPVYARKKEVPRSFLESIVGDARTNETKRVEEVVSARNVEGDLRKALEERDKTDVPVTLPLDDRSFDLVLLSNWENEIMYGPEDVHELPAVKSESQQDTNLTTPVNAALESGAWTQSIIWSPKAPSNLHEEDIVPEEKPAETARPRKRLRTDTQIKDKYNLSNDQYYEVSKEGGRHRVRQTFGQLVVEHAYPAQKLQLPFYKTRLSKQEALRTAKKKKDKNGRRLGKGGNIGDALKKTTDLSLRDTSNFVLWEYSEEHPPIISNFGMGSVLVNYYRKKGRKGRDCSKVLLRVLQSDLGVPFVLEPQDESPTDFLVIRNTTKGESKYFIREIKNLFAIGQTYPVTEVPGPHSRKITNTIKHRLQIIAFKLLRKSQGERLKISRLMKYFPDQNELQMRQRLKEFMEYHRRGPHQGFWRLKTSWTLPSDADMLKMVNPEQVVLTESMQVGQRHLQDAGYTQTTDVSDGDETKLSIEQQLAPWITTKNFLYATQAKAMLRLHGEGDPSGRGEAFNFIRISMKDIFVKAGEDYETKLAEAESRPKSAHRYNVAEQQQIYKSEIERIWKAQYDSLSRKDEPQLTEEDERRGQKQIAAAAAPPPPPSRGPYGGYGFPQLGDASPGMSRASSIDREGSAIPDDGAKRVLRIKRLVDGEWQTEIIRDQAVIRAYVRARQIMEEEATMADNLAPTGDSEKDKRAKKRLEEEIARMKKNQERRLHRKNAKIVKEGGTPMQLNRPLKPDTTRRCGHCGQMGHMKTNRKCPRWAEFNSGAAGAGPAPPPATASSTASSPPPPSAIPFSRGPSFGFPSAVPSPLATSPPMSAMDDEYGPPTPSGSAPKLKLTLKRN